MGNLPETSRMFDDRTEPACSVPEHAKLADENTDLRREKDRLCRELDASRAYTRDLVVELGAARA
jgi:hypothetical protein